MQKTFHMPVYQGEVFEERTVETLNRCFPMLTYTEAAKSVQFVEFRFFIPNNTAGHNIPEKYVQLSPSLAREDKDLTQEGQLAFRDLVLAWCMDALAEQTVAAHPLPWNSSNRMAQRYLSLFWRPEFCLLVQEHIGTYLNGDDSDPLGPNIDRHARTELASLILPPTSSNHEALKVSRGLERQMPALAKLWSTLAEADGQLAFELENPKSPIQI